MSASPRLVVPASGQRAFVVLQSDVQRVICDAALSEYGVVIAEGGCEVDIEATAARGK